MELLYKNWNEITINGFNRLQEILSDDDLIEIEKNIELIKFFTGLEDNEVLKLPVGDSEVILAEINKIFSSELPKTSTDKIESIKLNGTKYKITKKIDKLTVGQYIDFQNYISGGEKNLAEILSVFLVPEGFEYGEGYDTTEVITILKEKLDIITARGLFNFFINKLAQSTGRMLTYYRWMMKMMMWKTGIDKKSRKIINKMLKETQEMLGSTLLTSTQKQ